MSTRLIVLDEIKVQFTDIKAQKALEESLRQSVMIPWVSQGRQSGTDYQRATSPGSVVWTWKDAEPHGEIVWGWRHVTSPGPLSPCLPRDSGIASSVPLLWGHGNGS